MRVVDTSAWIEWLSGSQLGGEIATRLPINEEWIVPTIVQFELMRWASRALSQAQAESTIAFSKTLQVRALETDLATMAADLASQYGLAMADAIIYATARANRADLLTCDAHFRGLPGVVLLPKSQP